MKENYKNNEELKNQQNLITNNNLSETINKEQSSLKPIKTPPRSISERLNKPPIKKTCTVEGKKEIQPKSSSPEPYVSSIAHQSNGDLKKESQGKSLSPEPPITSSVQQNNTTEDRNKVVSFRLGEFQ